MASAGFEFDTVDVFTSTRFGGNPLAIIKIPHGKTLSQEEKQLIAREFNYSETVFLHAPEKPNEWRLDIFMITQELPLAGHPIVGATWIIGQDPAFTKGRLLCKAGSVDIEVMRDAGSLMAYASIPHNLHVHRQRMSAAEIVEIQPGLRGVLQSSDTSYPVVSIVKGMTFVLVELASSEALESVAAIGKAAEPQLDVEWNESFTGGYYYTLKRSGREFTLNVRMIEALLEDPATGSAACCISSYLALEAAKNEVEKGGEYLFDITQGVTMGRKSVIKVVVTINDYGKLKTVRLGGRSLHIMKGVFC